MDAHYEGTYILSQYGAAPNVLFFLFYLRGDVAISAEARLPNVHT